MDNSNPQNNESKNLAYADLPEEEQKSWEDKARAVGWQPKDEFKGNPEKHTDPKSYVERAKDNMPLLKNNNDRLYKVNEGLKNDLEELKQSTKAILEFNKTQIQEAHKKSEQAYERAKADLQNKQENAVKDGDLDAYRKHKAEEESLVKPEAPKPEKKEEKLPSDDFNNFLEKNPWYKNDRDMAAYAEAIGKRIVEDGFKGTTADFYDQISQKVKQDMPQKFKNPNRDEDPMFSEGSTNERHGGTTGLASLPPEAKAAFLQQVDMGIFTKDQVDEYIAIYNS